MRSDIADLKQKLETNEISKYCWIQDEKMIADILTKEKKEKFGLDDLLRDNKLDVLRSEDNCVTFEGAEFHITGRKLREKLTPKNKTPLRKKIKAIDKAEDNDSTKQEGRRREAGECDASLLVSIR